MSNGLPSSRSVAAPDGIGREPRLAERAPAGCGADDGVNYTCRRPDTSSMTERTAQGTDSEERRFAAVMLVVSVIVLVAIIREARSGAE